MTLALVATPKQFPTVKEMSDWLYAAFRERGYGESISYAEIGAVCTIAGQSHRAQTAARRAGMKMLAAENKLLVNVRGVGYRIAQPNEQANEIARYRRMGARRVRQGLRIAVHVDLAKIADPKERERHLLEASKVGLLEALMARTARTKKLPPREQIALPSSRALADLFTRKG